MMCPKVSVLVPVYNGELYLTECLNSIVTQDFRDLEILLCDDSSSDSSCEIIKKFAARDSRIRWWRNPHNVGLTANANICICAARGDYVKFVHQDDLLLTDTAISKLVSALDQNPSASLAGCRQHLTGTTAQPTILSDRAGCFNGRELIIASLEKNTNLIGQPSLTLFRRELAQRGFDERFTGFMDFEMWCHLLEQGDFTYVPEALASWRVHEHHQTARNRANGERELDHLRFMEIFYARPWVREAATARMLFAQIYYLNKKFGGQAECLIDDMIMQLGPDRFIWQWLKHKICHPLQKLSYKTRQTEAVWLPMFKKTA